MTLLVSEEWGACDTKPPKCAEGPRRPTVSLYIWEALALLGRLVRESVWDRKGQSQLTMTILSMHDLWYTPPFPVCTYRSHLHAAARGPMKRHSPRGHQQAQPAPPLKGCWFCYLMWDDWT